MTDYSDAGGHARALLRWVEKYLPDHIRGAFKSALDARLDAVRCEEQWRLENWLEARAPPLRDEYRLLRRNRSEQCQARLTALLEAVEVELSDTEDSLKQKMVRGKLQTHYGKK